MTVERHDNAGIDPEEMTYEQAVEALEEIIEQIEEGTIGIEESVEAYRRGTALIRRCRAVLDKAEQEIRTLEASADGGDAEPEPDA